MLAIVMWGIVSGTKGLCPAVGHSCLSELHCWERAGTPAPVQALGRGHVL